MKQSDTECDPVVKSSLWGEGMPGVNLLEGQGLSILELPHNTPGCLHQVSLTILPSITVQRGNIQLLVTIEKKPVLGHDCPVFVQLGLV